MSVEQLAFPLAEPQPGIDAAVSVARDAVDLNLRPGYTSFTDGRVVVERADGERIILATDSPWAASAIRRHLLQAGCAVQGDPAHEVTTVTIWPTANGDDTALPELTLTEQGDQYGRTTVLLDGPDGTVEQQVGSGGHNDLIVHARHPFPSAVRAECARHGVCWIRSQCWPLDVSPRRYIRTIVSEAGYAWDVTPEAGQAMRSLYLEHVHQTRAGVSAYRVIPQVAPVAEAAPRKTPVPAPVVLAPREVNAIRDLADYEPA